MRAKILLVFVSVLLLSAIGVLVLWWPGKMEIDIKKVRTQLRNDTLFANIELANHSLGILPKYTNYIRFTVHIDTFKIAEGEMMYEDENGQDHIEIPGSLSLEDMQSVIAANDDSATLLIQTDIGKKFPIIGMQNFHNERNMRIIRPQPPEYIQTGISDFSIKKDTVAFLAEGYLVNHNPVSITFMHTAMMVNLDDRFKADIALEPMLSVPPRDSVQIVTRITIQEFKLIKDGLAIVFGSDPMPYAVVGDLTMRLDSVDYLAPIEMNILHTGSVNLSPFY